MSLPTLNNSQRISMAKMPPKRKKVITAIEFRPSNIGYYTRLADNRDLLLSGYVYTETAPMVSAQYRHLTEAGAYQVTGYVTHGTRIPVGATVPTAEKTIVGSIANNRKTSMEKAPSLDFETTFEFSSLLLVLYL